MKNIDQVTAIVQARMGSTRLLGKVLMDIQGEPMLWRVLSRLKHCQKLGAIILAIPDTKENDILEEFAQKNKILFFRGKENDVLDRYYETAKKFGVETIARITADCPLIDPQIVDAVVEKYFATKADYASNCLGRTFPRGLDVEVFSFVALQKAFLGAKEVYQREHATPYIWENINLFKVAELKAPSMFNRPDIRLTVDTKEDLDFIREIYKFFAKQKDIFFTKDIIDLLDKHSELLKINSQIKQKGLYER